MLAWQAAATALVLVDYYDGYETLLNARYWLGEASSYRPARWPAMALLVLPAEWLRAPLGLHPLDPRIDHIASGSLHAATLVAVAHLLSRRCGTTWPTVAAFAAAIPTYVYFSYAPFLSNDIAPGAVLLAMILYSHDLLEARPRAATPKGLALVGLGAAAALVKPSLGLFWLAILLAAGTTAALRPAPERPRQLARVAWLAGAALLSAALYWAVCAAALPGEPGRPPWLAPYEQLRDLAASVAGPQPPVWLYLRNLPAYGVAAVVCVVPGLVLSWRSGGLGRFAALVWLVCVITMQLYVQREVRYLAFLAPTTALLLVPAFRLLGRTHTGALAAGALILVPALPLFPLSPLLAAGQILHPSLRANTLAALVAPLGWGEHRQHPLALLSYGLTDTSAGAESPLVGDPYHRIFHFGRPQLELLGYDPAEIRGFRPEALPVLAASGFQGAVLWSNHGALRNPYHWTGGPPTGRDTLQQACGRVAEIVLDRQPDGSYRTPRGASLRLRNALPPHAPGLVLEPSPELVPRLMGLQAPAILLPVRHEGSETLAPQHLARVSPAAEGLVGATIEPVAGVGLLARGAGLRALRPEAPVRLRGVRWQRRDPPAR